MSKDEAVKVWKDGAEDALDTAEKLLMAKKFHHALFFLHLSLEKILKAVFITNSSSNPPYIHNLALIAQQSRVKLNKEQYEKLDNISEFNVAGRYEDYKFKMYKKATPEFTKKLFDEGIKLYKLFSELLNI